MAAFAHARDAVPDALGDAWKRALEQWEDSARHDEMLRLVTQHDAYAWAAARYRERLREHAGDAIATERLERVRRAAEATLMSSASARATKTPEPYRNTMAILALLMLLVVAGLVYAMWRHGREADAAASQRPLPGGK